MNLSKTSVKTQNFIPYEAKEIAQLRTKIQPNGQINLFRYFLLRYAILFLTTMTLCT